MVIVGQERIAEVFGVAPKTIVQWQEDGFPVLQRGGPGVASHYESADCIRWYAQRELRLAQVERPQDRLARLQGDELTMKIAAAQKILVPADQIEPKLRAAFVGFRERLGEMRSALVPQLVGRTAAEMAHVLEAAHTDALALLARWNQADNVDDDDELGDASP